MTDDNFTRDDDVAEEEEEVDETVKSFRAVKDAVLFAIDRIISNPHDMMGVLLYGTESTKFYDEDGNTGGDLSYPHCYLFTDLDIPSAQEVKNLRALAGNEENARGILRPSSERVSMANVLFCANQIFTTKAPNFLSRRLFIVTDDDNPHQDNKSLRSAATVRARDLYDLSVNIELFPISRPDHEFDTSKFYDDIIYKPSPRDGEAPTYLQPDTKTPTGKGGGISLLNSLLSSINSRAVPRRSLFSNVPLEIGPNFKIAVNGYLLLKKQEPARSCYVWLGGEKPQIVKGITAHMADDTAQTVQKSEIRKAYKFGGEQVTFTPEELQALRNFGDPVIRIIGFKPLSALPIWANVKHPSFIYPSEDDFVGSTRVFSALHQKLLKDQKIAIVWFIPRKNSAPVVAAMIAGEERLDENGVQKVPPGMWLIPLPFVDDVRENPPAVLRVSPDNLTDAMRQVIGQLQLPRGAYDAQKYPNPALQWHYRILQALALDEDYPGEPEDKTKPKYRQIDKRAGDYVLEWSRLLDMIFDKMYGGQAATTSTLVKREARDAGEGASRPPAKRVKTEEPADLEEQVRQCYERGTLKKLTLHVLKSFLNAHGRATAGKKDDLIDQVEQYFERKN